jgi:mono/diheme cytochrome c family protein
MKNLTIKVSLSVLGLALCGSVVLAQQKTDFGKREFEANCASCHGVNGKGNGQLVEFLRRSPPDLTLLAKNNQGVFPMNRLYDVIDGANVPSHGTRDMPVWGRDYRIKDAEYYADAPYDAAAMVRSRILALLEYINRLQVR